jgi:serine/threonine-protein kinase
MSTRPPHPQGSEGTQPLDASGAIPFDVLAEIAAGATARVDLCRLLAPHPRAGGLVAVKRLHPHIAEDPTFVKQFLDEVRFTYWLRHPNVVEVAGWGTDQQGSYLAVELVQGVSLLRLMKTIFDTGEAFTERMVVYIAAKVCGGLVAAHSLRAPNGEVLNLVHRDLTPSNVLVGFDGAVKITDFGMAKAKQRLTKTLTGMRKGEPTYMAPEQARSDEIDARADLFSLGVMLFELFAGRRPWIAKSDYEMVQITTREPPADLRELRPKIDRELVHVVNRCLEKEPSDRYQSAREIAQRLDEWLTVHGYQEGNEEALGRFVRRNAMRQMRWFERAIAGELVPERVGRDLPRVPTYTEHTRHPSEPPPPESLPTPPPAPIRGPARPRLPSRPTGTPADPRSIRAANVVQQLKKLAPPIEPPRARQRRSPSLDDDGDATDVELRIGNRLPRLHSDPGTGEEEVGEEAPTLVQKGDAKVQAIRAEARARRMAADAAAGPNGVSIPNPPRPRSGYPNLIADEDSDQRITEVKREEQRRALVAMGAPPPSSLVAMGAPPPSSLAQVADPDTDIPTTPISRGRPHLPEDASEAPTPIAPQKAKTTPVNVGVASPAPRRPSARGDGAPPVRAIPPSPNIPPQPFPQGGSARPPAMPAERTPPFRDAPAMRTAIPPSPGVPSAARPQKPEPVLEQTPPVISLPPDPSRTSHHDDVQVIDRAALQQHAAPPSEDALVAEADRLAIEAVRRSEEARAAQLRAERKIASAKVAGDAAMIAADAVRMLRGPGLAAAVKRMEEARSLDANLQSGKIPTSETTASLRAAMSSFNGPVSSPSGPRSMEGPPSGPLHPSQPPVSMPIFAGAAADPPGPIPLTPSYTPPPPDPPRARPGADFQPGGHAGGHPQTPGHPGGHPQTPGHPGGHPHSPGPPAQPQRPPMPLAESEAFHANLRPSLVGTPKGAMVALVVVGLGVVLLLVVLLAK